MIALPRRQFLIAAAGLIAAPVIVRASAIMPVKSLPLIVFTNPFSLGSHLYIKKEYIGRFDTFDGAMSMAQDLGHVHPAGDDEGGRRYGVADSDVAIHTIVIVEWNDLSTVPDSTGWPA